MSRLAREELVHHEQVMRLMKKRKIELSSSQSTDVNLPYITADATGPKHLNVKISRAKLESLVEDLVQRTIEPCRIALKDAGIDVSKINDVILVGGQTRMPMVSIPRVSGLTSSNRTSLTSPANTAPWIAAPIATASSGFTSLRASLPKNSVTSF